METQAMIATALCFGIGLILSGLSKKGQKEGWIIFSFWGAVIGGRRWTVKTPKDAFFRMCADVFVNFVYPTFLFFTFPIFVATSTSYMDAISKATGVFFAVKWDAESEKYISSLSTRRNPTAARSIVFTCEDDWRHPTR